TNRKIDTGKTLTRWPVFVDHFIAAHFMMSGGNILALQKILGHHDIKMTMRYAHLAPDHLETALRFNPLATLPSGDKVAAAVGITP
ncbi:tyrosine-type recombinase/integrase, partial [Shigella boydii]